MTATPGNIRATSRPPYAKDGAIHTSAVHSLLRLTTIFLLLIFLLKTVQIPKYGLTINAFIRSLALPLIDEGT